MAAAVSRVIHLAAAAVVVRNYCVHSPKDIDCLHLPTTQRSMA